MNPAVQKYAPPAIVLGAALYMGWPPAEPMDLGDNVVKAKAVRWRTSELDPPPAPGVSIDPFRDVLVVKEEPKPVDEVIQVPVGPTVEEIRAVLTLSGIANLGGRPWAVLNDRARLMGDTIKTGDEKVGTCELVEVHTDHVVVRCQETIAIIRPQVSRKTNTKAAPTSPDPVAPVVNEPAANELGPAPPAPPAPNVGLPPQA